MDRRALAVLFLVGLMALSGYSGSGAQTEGGQGGYDLPTSVEDAEPWTDGFDSIDNVYIPPGGLIGTQVTGGRATLEAGSSEGWIASSVIPCPLGVRYDMVVLDMDLPGDSRVEVSILDATAEATEVGYANATIANHKDLEQTAISLRSIDQIDFPSIRVQATFFAGGTNIPSVDGWTVYYSPLDEWREDFVSQLRMDTLRGLNLTDGRLELDLSEKTGTSGMSSGTGEPFPAIVFDRYQTGGSPVMNTFYANFDRTGYDDMTDLSCKGTAEVALADLDGDGLLDLIAGNKWLNNENQNSQIYWGQSDGKWTSQDTTDLEVERTTGMATGDFNGDGETDLAFACYHQTGTTSSGIFLNQGNGVFNSQLDIEFTDEEYYLAGAGDFNDDGYDDVIFSVTSNTRLYYGGPDGPDTTCDLNWVPSAYVYDIITEDLDGDGIDDLLVTYDPGDHKTRIYMGSSSGMDATSDHRITVGDDTAFGACAGDLNGDGYKEIVIMGLESSTRFLYVFEGGADGWDDSNPVKIPMGTNYVYASQVADVNADGYGDLVAGVGEEMRIYYGGEGTMDATADITKDGLWCTSSCVVAAGGRTSNRKYAGRLVTQEIHRPAGKAWDTLVLEGSTPANTSVTVTVKDSSNIPVPGMDDVAVMDLDLTGLTSMSIKVELWLESDLNTSTPVIDRLRVRWQDPNTWREQFFGPSKTARMLGTGITQNQLTATGSSATGMDLLFASLRDGDGYNSPSVVVSGRGNVTFQTSGASAVAAADIDGNGFPDILFATHQTSDTNYKAGSPLYMGTPVGWRTTPDHTFPTAGASDVLLRDLNGDGYVDVVFAQEYDGSTYRVNSTLFWGGPEGWSDEPDAEFETTAARGVTAADLDGDGDLDLAFACYRSASTATDSMVFYQDGGAFPASPGESLPTMGATAVAAGDIDTDGAVDLVFANSFSGGFAEIDSYVYWGRPAGGFSAQPGLLPTKGAQDVVLADLDGDGDLDVAFANGMDNSQNASVDSCVYINDGGSLGSTPDAEFPTLGASGVAVADLDGTGRMDLVFSSLEYAGDHVVPSRVYLGGSGGWSAIPDAEVVTTGASDVLACCLVRTDTAGYLSKAITPSDPYDTGAFETLLYTAHMEGSRTGAIGLVDADTWEVLATRDLEDGSQQWTVRDEFAFRDHTSVRVMVSFTDLDLPGDLRVDDLWINWSKRVRLPPVVEALDLAASSIPRTTQTTINVTVRDEYTPLEQLTVRIEYRLVGSEEWDDALLSTPKWADGVWSATFKALAKTELGTYEFRVNVTDGDALWSGEQVCESTLEVLNRLPTAPAIQMTPARPVTTSALRVEVTQAASDPENFPLTYHYRWYRDGTLVPELTGDVVPPSRTLRGENWTVEVCAYDGFDEGPTVRVYRIIQNAAPLVVNPLPDPSMDEDGTDSDWLDLSHAFEDPDGDAITWTVDPAPLHVTVTIDPTTGKVTLVPEADWNGDEELTFVCSDGELQSSQTVTVTVFPVNDIPEIVALNGEPFSGDLVEYTIDQGDTLTITPTVVDVEGHELVFDVNTTAVEVDGATGVITFLPDNDAVGTLRFALSVHDIVSPTVKVKVNLVIHVVNGNDPMEEPSITNPVDGDEVKANVTFYVTVVCYDPDTPYGQVLNYTWTSSVEGLLGYGNTLTLKLTEVGQHVITVTVSDGEFQKSDSVTITVTPASTPGPGPGPGPGDDPDDDPKEEGTAMSGIMVGVVIALLAAGAGGFVIVSRGRTREVEEEAEPEMDEREALQAIADMAKEAADTLEESKNGNSNGTSDGGEVWVEDDVTDGIQVASTGVAEAQLSMEATISQQAPAEVEALFADIEANGFHASEEDAEQLRLDNMKRKYAITIGQLPYGIPSAALKEWDWNDLAAALATGEKRQVDGDAEVTLIEGRWYYSDTGDPSTFLKEHGAKAREPVNAPKNTDLLAKLEERFILGEISEESYIELRRKYAE